MIAALAWRAAPYLAGAALVLVLGGALYQKGYGAGNDAARAACLAREEARRNVEAQALARRIEDNAALARRHHEANLKEAFAHEQADRAVLQERERLRLDVRRAGGLRIPIPAACGGPAAQAETPAHGQPAAGAAGTVALPESIEEDLLSLAADADQVVEQARAMQKRLVEDAKEE